MLVSPLSSLSLPSSSLSLEEHLTDRSGGSGSGMRSIEAEAGGEAGGTVPFCESGPPPASRTSLSSLLSLWLTSLNRPILASSVSSLLNSSVVGVDIFSANICRPWSITRCSGCICAGQLRGALSHPDTSGALITSGSIPYTSTVTTCAATMNRNRPAGIRASLITKIWPLQMTSRTVK
eukprot:CAMPEP_0173266036 /NCGR_PEP_ID=MMETSP1142-20121109/28937_1 /TAXON_ID=483371 /ORGANISM="non described non described, Strain CCMP2298" /LENGTH=178 /DNA_ID=CAMNT_0014201901 /DNA_START=904 /DNA_END=1440 /DNA_ORIENTATION=-